MVRHSEERLVRRELAEWPSPLADLDREEGRLAGGRRDMRAALANGPFRRLWLAELLTQTAQNALWYTALVLVERASYGKDFDRVAYTNEVIDVLEAHGVELVVMAGFGTIFEKPMFDVFDGRIINTHPALLPAFPGWHAVRDALAAGVKVTGVTVHIATLEVDAGPIIAQAPVPVEADDDEATLHERIKAVERQLYPDTIKEILQRGSVQ